MEHMQQPAARYRMDDLVIDTATRRVLRNGVDLDITGLTFDLLLVLGGVAPALLSFDEILARVWPRQLVSNEVLTQRIKLLRQQLGDSAGHPRYIASRRGHGYRLLSPMIQSSGTDVDSGNHSKAHDLYLQARTVARGTHDSTENALRMINEALSHDPRHAAAVGYRAFLLSGSVMLGGKPVMQLQAAEQDAALALELDPQLPDAHTALGILAAWRYRWDEADQHFQHALALAPAMPFYRNLYASMVLRPVGRLRDARRELEKSYELDPAEGFTSHELAMTLCLLGDDPEAMRFARLSLALSGVTQPHWDLQLMQARLLCRGGDYREAASCAIQAMPRSLQLLGSTGVLMQLYAALAKEIPVAPALAALTAFLPKLEDPTIDRRTRSFFMTACVALNDSDSAFRLLELYRKLPEARRPTIEPADLWLPELSAFRADKRFTLVALGFNLPNHAAQ